MTTAAEALQSKIFQVIAGGQGLPHNSFVSFVGGGIALDQAHMSWATQLPPYAGTQDADNAFAFATIVNTIPPAAGAWQAGTASMAFNYRNVFLNQAIVPEVQLTPAQVQQRDNAQARVEALFDEYTQFQTDWQNANTALQLAIFAPHDATWFQNVLLARQAVGQALTAWQVQGHKSEFEHNRAIVQHFGELGFETVIQNLKDQFDAQFTANVTQAAINFAPVSLFPNNFLEPNGPTWNHFHISQSEFSRYHSTSSTTSSSGFDVPFLFWDVAQGGSTNWTSVNRLNVSSSQIDVDFDFIRVRLDRSDWFDSNLLTSNSWWYPGATKALPQQGGPLFSNGAVPPLTSGQWQMIPTEMLVTRNLRVFTNNFNLQDALAQSSSQNQDSSGFLFWSTSSTSSTSTSNSYHHEFQDPQTLFLPQPQIIAFMCQLMGKEPNPDVNLLPA